MNANQFAFRLAHQQIPVVIALYSHDIRLLVSELRDIATAHRMAGDVEAAELLDASALRIEQAYVGPISLKTVV